MGDPDPRLREADGSLSKLDERDQESDAERERELAQRLTEALEEDSSPSGIG